MEVDLTVLATVVGGGITLLGGQKVISLLFKRWSESRISDQEQERKAVRQARQEQQQYELNTSGSLIDQLRRQNEEMSAWLMALAAGDLRTTAAKATALDLRVAEIYAMMDTLSREHQGFYQDLAAVKVLLDDILQHLHSLLQNQQPADSQSSEDTPIKFLTSEKP